MTTRRLLLSLLSLTALLAVVVALSFYLLGEFPALEAERSLASNLGFFLLINLNIIVVMILGFLVTKNLVKLVLDRRRNILGAKLRSRLVAAFVGLSLIPTLLLFLVAKGMLERGMEEWLSPQMASAVDGALGVARYHYDSAEAQVYRQVRQLSRKLTELFPYAGGALDSPEAEDRADAMRLLRGYLTEKREEYGLFDLAIVDRAGRTVVRAEGLDAPSDVVEIPGVHRAVLRRAVHGAIVVRPEQSMNGEFLRGYAPVQHSPLSGVAGATAQLASSGPTAYAVVATQWVLPELSSALGSVVSAFDDYKELKTYRRPLASSYFLTLVVVTLLILFAAIWVGFYLARDLSIPIGLLAEGTQQVAHGNLTHRIPEVGDDELSVLVRSFNTMTKDLSETTSELVARRRYMETILARVGVGVIAVDTQSCITTFNIAAGEMLGITQGDTLLSRRFPEVLPSELSKKLLDMLLELYSGDEKLLSANITLEREDGAKHIQLTATELVDEKGDALGAVVLLDDLTELVNAQRMAAWQEVARRIAHEIKNPLTPIQLCAERMRRKFSTADDRQDQGGRMITGAERSLITESTETIIKQVENLRTLVNEFSQFARMPKSTPKPAELNAMLREVVTMYRDAHTGIEFETAFDPTVPVFALDREQFSRALINLIDNAVASLHAAAEQASDGRRGRAREALRSVTTLLVPSSKRLLIGREPACIRLESKFNPALEMVTVTVADNGAGISDKDKTKLFEPYYSTKRGGTGLGLAIVNTIVADHDGFIRVRDNQPRGAVFIIELPTVRQELLRPFA